MINKTIKLKGLFLDDERNPQDLTWIQYPENIEWVVARSYTEFFEVFQQNYDFDLISFDHDIQSYIDNQEKTGYDCIKTLLNYYPEDYIEGVLFFFHTQNPIGKKNMESYYQNYIKFVKGQN